MIFRALDCKEDKRKNAIQFSGKPFSAQHLI